MEKTTRNIGKNRKQGVSYKKSSFNSKFSQSPAELEVNGTIIATAFNVTILNVLNSTGSMSIWYNGSGICIGTC